MSDLRITATIRAASKPGSVKAYADVRVQFSSSTLEIFGVSIIQQDPAKPAWVSYPRRAAKNGMKYFAIVTLTGLLHDKICGEVLAEWERTLATPTPRDRAGVPPAKIPREPGEEAF